MTLEWIPEVDIKILWSILKIGLWIIIPMIYCIIIGITFSTIEKAFWETDGGGRFGYIIWTTLWPITLTWSVGRYIGRQFQQQTKEVKK